MPQNQAGNEYSAEIVVAIERSLSPERFNAYVVQTKGDRNAAILLYERNTELSEALYGVIQGLEIGLRNSVHRVLRSQMGFDDWYDHISLESSEAEALNLAKESVTSRHKPLTAPRIIAQLGFGFWVRLTSGAYEKALWVPCLYKVFPMRTNRRRLNLRLLKIKDLRNKIAHHERIVDRDLDTDYVEILETIGWLCPITSNWVKNTTRFQKLSKLSGIGTSSNSPSKL
jgi:hypothetical protein